jgi:hypothetical protein
MGRLLEYDHGKRPSTKKYYPEPHHPSVSLLCKWIFGENKRDIDNQHGVELDLLAANQPYSPMINRWCCEQHRIREIGLLPLHVDYLFKTGYCKEPKSSPTRDFPRNIWRKEKIRVKMREEASKWPRWICLFRIEDSNFFLRGRRLVRERTSCAGEEK